MLYLIPLLQSLLYLASIPVCIAFCVDGTNGVRAGAGAGTFSARAALRRARRNMIAPKPKRRKTRVSIRRILRLLARIRLERVSVKGRLGLSDAAATALLCGGVSALGAALGTRAASVEVAVVPAFDGARLELRGMIRARIGQIIVAAARSQF